MVLTQSQFNTLLIPLITHHFEVGQNRVPRMRTQLFSEKRSTLAQENGTGMGGMTPESWNAYASTGKKGKLDVDQLYTQTYTHQEYPVQLEIKKNLILNDQYGKIADLVRRAGISAEQKMEIDAASLLTNAFSASFLWSDAKALCATDHPQSPTVTAGTFSNKGTSALTADVVSTTRVAMMRFKDDKGTEIGLMPNELWVPPELEDTARKIVASVLDPESANNAINPQAGRWTVKPWMRLTDTNNWFMADSTWRQEVANWYVRETTTPMIVAETTTEIVYEFKLHYSFGVDDWRWIYGHEVA